MFFFQCFSFIFHICLFYPGLSWFFFFQIRILIHFFNFSVKKNGFFQNTNSKKNKFNYFETKKRYNKRETNSWWQLNNTMHFDKLHTKYTLKKFQFFENPFQTRLIKKHQNFLFKLDKNQIQINHITIKTAVRMFVSSGNPYMNVPKPGCVFNF